MFQYCEADCYSKFISYVKNECKHIDPSWETSGKYIIRVNGNRWLFVIILVRKLFLVNKLERKLRPLCLPKVQFSVLLSMPISNRIVLHNSCWCTQMLRNKLCHYWFVVLFHDPFSINTEAWWAILHIYMLMFAICKHKLKMSEAQ